MSFKPHSLPRNNIFAHDIKFHSSAFNIVKVYVWLQFAINIVGRSSKGHCEC